MLIFLYKFIIFFYLIVAVFVLWTPRWWWRRGGREPSWSSPVPSTMQSGSSTRRSTNARTRMPCNNTRAPGCRTPKRALQVAPRQTRAPACRGVNFTKLVVFIYHTSLSLLFWKSVAYLIIGNLNVCHKVLFVLPYICNVL